MAWTKLAKVSELPTGALIEVEHGEKIVALCNVEGEIRAMSGVCPHQGGPLGEGMLNGSLVTCPWHMWEFDSGTGVCAFSSEVTIPTYAVRVEADSVLVNMPDA